MEIRPAEISEILKKQIAAGAWMGFRADAAAADGHFERRTYCEYEFVARESYQHALITEAQVGESAGASLLAFLLEALVADEEREAGFGRDRLFEVERLGILGAIVAARDGEIVLDGRVIADEVADE